MTTPNYIIRIPEPCHEDWNKMQPDEKGKFCDSCSKSVFDFSTKTDTEINTILVEHKDQKVCGHFKKTQINRPLNLSFDLKNLPKNISSTKAFAIALFLVFGTLLFSCTNEKNQLVGAIEVTNKVNEPEVEVVGSLLYVPPQIAPNSLVETNTVDGGVQYTETMVNGGLRYEEVPAIVDSNYTEAIVVTEAHSEYRTMGLMAIEIVQGDTNVTPTDTVLQKNTITQIGDNVISRNTDLSIYPNPSTGEFTIKYDVTQRADVKIDIYDIKGSIIKTIIDTPNQHTGKYQIPVNLNELPSGIYIINLITNGKRFTEKVVVEK